MNSVFMGIRGVDVRKWRSTEEERVLPPLKPVPARTWRGTMGFEPTGDPTIDQFREVCEIEKSAEFKSGLVWGGIGGLILGGLVVAFGGRIF